MTTTKTKPIAINDQVVAVTQHAVKLRSVLHYSGLPIDARSVTDSIEEQEGLKRPHHAGALVSAER